MTSPSVVIVHENPLLRSLIANYLTHLGTSVRVADSYGESRVLLGRSKVDLVIFDLLVADPAATLEFIAFIRNQNPDIGLVVLTTIPEPRLIGLDAAKLPKNLAYLLTNDAQVLALLGLAIKEALRGRYPRQCRQHLDAKHALSVLSNSQLSAVSAIAKGLSNQSIAAQRGTTVRAVENLIKRALDQLGLELDAALNSRVMATRLYLSTIGGKPTD